MEVVYSLVQGVELKEKFALQEDLDAFMIVNL